MDDIQSKPFAVQMQYYMGALFTLTRTGFSELAETLDVRDQPEVKTDALQHISQGAPCPALLAKQLAAAFLIEPPEAVESFEKAAAATRAHQSLAELIDNYAAVYGIESERAKTQLFNVKEGALKRAKSNNSIDSYQNAVALADQLCASDEQKRNFFSRYSAFHYDDHQVLDLLRAHKIGITRAVRSLCAMRDMTLKAACEKAGIPRTVYTHWGEERDNNTRLPQREHMEKLLASNVLNIAEREPSEVMFAAAECFIDPAHIIKCLRHHEIDFAKAVGELIKLRYPSSRAYAAARGVQPGVIVEWAKGNIPRKELLALSQGFSREDTLYLLEQAGMYLDATHINDRFKDSKRLDHFIDAVKNAYAMTDDDFGVDSGTMSNLRNTIHTPRTGILAKIFFAMEQQAPELDWYVFKTTAARFMGIKPDSHEFIEFSRRINAERARLTTNSGVGAGASPASPK